MSSLAKLNKARAPKRSLVTRTVNAVNALLVSEKPDGTEIEILQKKIVRLSEELSVLDNQITDALLDDENLTDEVYAAEIEAIDGYASIIESALVRAERVRSKCCSSEKDCETSSTSSQSGKKLRVKLPKLAICKFSGEALDWISWWAQFMKIHDSDLDDGEKFEYLSAAMTPKTRAYELVHSYPMSAANYPKAIAALTDRFGKPKILKQLYVRELLKLVVSNAKSSTVFELAPLYDKLESHLRALESLAVAPEQISEFVFPMVESSLPEEILVAWQRSPYYHMDETIPRLKDKIKASKTELDFLMAFLACESESETQRKVVRAGFESINSTQKNSKNSSPALLPVKRSNEIPASAAALCVNDEKTGEKDKRLQKSCAFCNYPHDTVDCRKYGKLTHEEKLKKLSKAKTCFKCLMAFHRDKDCRNHVECSVCHETTHLKQLCKNTSSERNSQLKTDHSADKTASKSLSALNTDNFGRGDVFLKTLLVQIGGTKGSIIARLMFDEGSQRSSITTNAIKKIAPSYVSSDWQRNILFGNVLTEPRKIKSYQVEISSLDGSNKTTLILKETPEICGSLPCVKMEEWLIRLKNKGIELSDLRSDEETPSTVDILIGSDYWGSLITSAPQPLEKEGLYAVNSKFGWTISGTENILANQHIVQFCLNQSRICDLWELEAIGIKPEPTDSVDELVQEQFDSTIQRAADGRYIVKLPWKEDPFSLPSNRAVAEKRLRSTSQRLISHSMYDAYNDLFVQWEEDKLIKKITSAKGFGHYLPHRAVYRPTSKTTPVRPVFDASCKIGKNSSLNECLYSGPNLLELLPAVYLKFRENETAFTADIGRAFQMICVHEQDCDFLRFLWWDDKSQTEVQEFQHLRVVFGLKCGPYLLAAVIKHHLKNWKGDVFVILLLLCCFYADNCVGSLDSKKYFFFKQKAIEIMGSAGMDLREWTSTLEPTGVVNVLGVQWNSYTDKLSLAAATTFQAAGECTRSILSSTLQKIFDPMGFFAPCLMSLKIWIQESWRYTPDWDCQLPQEIEDNYYKWCSEFASIRDQEIDRYLHFDKGSVQLHVFCDASEKGYAAVIYARVIAETVMVKFVQACTRLAPIKPLSIPRLELMGCLIGSRLLHSTIKGLSTPIQGAFLWSDSATALSWITNGNDWSVFVRNRIKEIHQLTNPEQWRHVPGKINIADIASRGCFPSKFDIEEWWEGPDWLKSEDSWPINEYVADEELVQAEALKKSTNLACNSKEIDAWYLPTSSFTRNVRILAYILRFCKRKKFPTFWLTREEYKAAECWILQCVQADSFSDISKFPVKVVTQESLLRVKTKLERSKFDQAFTLPILLPDNHPVVDQIVQMEHLKSCHGGPSILSARLRRRFWVIHARKVINQIRKKCIICQRLNAKKGEAPEGSLPPARTELSRVFSTTGIDLAGPIFCKDGTKCWLVLFTCAVYRAIHLEVVSSLSTDDFLLAFRRFVCQRGRPSLIYTDNGTNFEGADNLFSLIDWNKVMHIYASEPIQWRFNPPSAPWWGGFWEIMIKIVKNLLKRMLGKRKLTLAQIENLLFDIEAVVNCRPLTYIDTESADTEPLTPAHFLHDIPDESMPELENLPANQIRKRFKLLSQMRLEIKLRFQREYLATLVHRGKNKKTRDLRLGEVVLIGDENRRQLWSMGRIIQFLPAEDGSVRLVKLKTQHSELLRPLQRIYPLEIEDKELPTIQNIVVPLSLPVIVEKECKLRSRFGRVIKKPLRFRV